MGLPSISKPLHKNIDLATFSSSSWLFPNIIETPRWTRNNQKLNPKKEDKTYKISYKSKTNSHENHNLTYLFFFFYPEQRHQVPRETIDKTQKLTYTYTKLKLEFHTIPRWVLIIHTQKTKQSRKTKKKQILTILKQVIRFGFT